MMHFNQTLHMQHHHQSLNVEFAIILRDLLWNFNFICKINFVTTEKNRSVSGKKQLLVKFDKSLI